MDSGPPISSSSVVTLHDATSENLPPLVLRWTDIVYLLVIFGAAGGYALLDGIIFRNLSISILGID